MSKLRNLVETYRNLAQIPALIGARLNNDENYIQTYWQERNLENGKTAKFLIGAVIGKSLEKITEVLPVDVSSQLLSSISPSEKYRATLREVGDKQFLEVWSKNNLYRCVDLSSLDLHGNIYTDGEFSSFMWSPDERKLLYVAELKIKKSEPFYKRKAKPDHSDEGAGTGAGDDDGETKGEEYLYRQDWGEQLVGKKRSVLALYDVENDAVEILEGIPENVVPARPVFSNDGSYIVGMAYYVEPRKLGLIYCSNRPATIFRLDFQGNYLELPLENVSTKSPRFTLDGETLVWLQRSAEGPHAATLSLMKVDAPFSATSQPETVIDVVKSSKIINNERTFYGLYCTSFVRRCWASDNRLILSTNQQNTVNSYVIDIETGNITELEYNNGSQIVLDVHNDIVLVSRRNFLRPDILAIGKLPPKGCESTIIWFELTENIVISGLEHITYKYLDIAVQSADDAVKTSTTIYLGPSSGVEKSTPLIVWPHGGPHSAFVNNLSLECSLFLSLGYAVLLINYRGSTGTGQDSIDYLLGKIGSSDVADCIASVQTALKEFPWLDPNRLALVGGSHGGFLVTHLSGQYPDMFKVVVARNPVVDVAVMSVISDIPDWSFSEAGYEYTQKDKVDDDAFLNMRKCSPIEHAHKVKAPTLLQIGSKDLRVPMHQGIEYYHRLKANGVTARLNLYDDNHPLGTVPNEMDNLINTVLWLQKHIDNVQ